MAPRFHPVAVSLVAAIALLAFVPSAAAGEASPESTPANAPDQATPKEATAAPGLPALSWLEGCWQATLNKRDVREVWLPYRGNLMLGVSQTVLADKTVDYEYLRLETRADGVYYVAASPGQPEAAFKLAGETVDQEDAHTFSFLDPGRDFPSRIGYRRATEGWLYIEVEGKVNGADRKVIYPMRRVDCGTGEFIRR